VAAGGLKHSLRMDEIPVTSSGKKREPDGIANGTYNKNIKSNLKIIQKLSEAWNLTL
jgi:hypothetical protein